MTTYTVDWTNTATDDVYKFGDYVAQHSSLREGEDLVNRLFKAGDTLAWSPQRYAPAPEWGEGVRRMPLLGRRILFKVEEAEHVVRILAVVGGRENPRSVR